MNEKNLEFSFDIHNINVEARLDCLNMSKNIKPASYETHSHTMYEAYFIESGTLSLQCTNNSIELKKHDILIINPNTEHKIISCDDNLKRFNFRFLFPDIKIENVITKAPYTLYECSKEVRKKIFENIIGIHLYFNGTNHVLDSFRIKSCFGIIVSHIAEQLLPTDFFKSRSIVKKNATLTQYIIIDDFFDKNYSKHITISDLANELNYSTAHTNRLLKNRFNMTFSQKLSQVRLNASKKYLKNTTLTTSEIAYKCGFSSTRGFELFFKKHTKFSPKEYRSIDF